MVTFPKSSLMLLVLSCSLLFVCVNIKSVEGSCADSTIDELANKFTEVQQINWNLEQTNLVLANEIKTAESSCNLTISRLTEYHTLAELELGNHDSTAKNLFERIKSEELIQSELESKLINLHDQLELLDILYVIYTQDQLIRENRDTNRSSQVCAKFDGNLEERDLNKNEIGTRALSRKQTVDHFKIIELEFQLKFASIESTKLKAENARLSLKKNHTEYLCELIVSDKKHMIENTEYLIKNSSHAIKIATVDLAINQLLTKSLQVEYKLGENFMGTLKGLISHYQTNKQVNTILTTNLRTQLEVHS